MQSRAATFAPVSGTDLLPGRGYNTLTGATGADCVKPSEMVTLASSNRDLMGLSEGTDRASHCTATGQCVEFRLSQVTSAKQLRESLDVDAKASFGFGVFQGDVSARYYKENKFSNNNIYIILNVKVTNMPEVLRKLELTDYARSLLERDDLSGFLDSCGDSFIGGRTTGGEFTAVIKIETSSSENKREIEAKLRASGIGWSASTGVARSLSEINQNNSMTIEMFKKGGIGALPDHADIDSVFNFARNIPIALQSNANPAIYLLTAMEYKTVSNRPRVNTLLRAQNRALNAIAERRDAAYELWGNADFILAHPTQFEPFDTQELELFRSAVNTTVNTLNDAAMLCEESPQTCQLPNINLPTFNFPVRLTPAVPTPMPGPNPTSPTPEAVRLEVIPGFYQIYGYEAVYYFFDDAGFYCRVMDPLIFEKFTGSKTITGVLEDQFEAMKKNRDIVTRNNNNCKWHPLFASYFGLVPVSLKH